MRINENEVRRIAALAQLELSDESVEKMGGQLSRILDYVDQLNEVDTSSLETSRDTVFATPFGEDEPRPSLRVEQIEQNAPSFAHGHFVVPKVIGGE